MDIIFIKKLIVMAFIGVYDWEQQRLQKLIFDIEVGWNNVTAALSDNINDSISYTAISEAVLSWVHGKHFALIERVAEEVAELLINKFSLTWVRIKIQKPSAVPYAKSVGVIIQRSIKELKN
ncbi:dihydroneopterin aldolase [Candidatus Palibaumannia cicadellinicola]|uniref:7,8-dihydroneopterin aldolase n=1 Tax=Baumannia cicadellinicola subsp. Homalodisca coagulata TaxID=374463 RepID=Q1LSL9_BAUCH|nr:dihydroneopterin aldolase [Candidatus Baumannia cicadellinicola]ABF14130.1 dihydroneopterin aldolase [Baumannia cicadellinicola str. Hc (Homalodisca coagulata)]MBS0032518.1 dihydroneopterin aldolase [Candidatus Baumannia cicadellinicola]MCJ7461960.1 dihydroneopterin aldolase [Candidatus Baumannia cicadellinicola]MCJ7462868.1 dihydroneopterin aldolase [Candidatus Baumannia cicadellinicola]